MVRARRPSRLLAVGLGLTALVLVMQATDVLEPWELDTVDARFAIRGDEKPPPDLVTVLIDTKTFNDLPPSLARWPFRRIVHARVLDRVREDGVRAVVARKRTNQSPRSLLARAPTRVRRAPVTAGPRARQGMLDFASWTRR